MANPNRPFGFEVITSDGKEIRTRRYKKSAGIIYPGDVLKLLSTGDCNVAAAGDAMIGVCAAYAASADTDVLVYDDPQLEFITQMTGSFAAADVNLNANIDATTGDTALKQSKNSLDTATQAVTATLQFKILGVLSRGDNAVGNYCIVRCRPNNHVLKGGTGAAGV